MSAPLMPVSPHAFQHDASGVANDLTADFAGLTIKKGRRQALQTPASSARPRKRAEKENEVPHGSEDGASTTGVTPSRLDRIKELREELSCSICLEICVRPCTTPCGHSFCRSCLRTSLEHNLKCAKCREPLPAGYVPKINTSLWNTIQLLFPTEAGANPVTPPEVLQSHAANARGVQRGVRGTSRAAPVLTNPFRPPWIAANTTQQASHQQRAGSSQLQRSGSAGQAAGLGLGSQGGGGSRLLAALEAVDEVLQAPAAQVMYSQMGLRASYPNGSSQAASQRLTSQQEPDGGLRMSSDSLSLNPFARRLRPINTGAASRPSSSSQAAGAVAEVVRAPAPAPAAQAPSVPVQPRGVAHGAPRTAAAYMSSDGEWEDEEEGEWVPWNGPLSRPSTAGTAAVGNHALAPSQGGSQIALGVGTSAGLPRMVPAPAIGTGVLHSNSFARGSAAAPKQQLASSSGRARPALQARAQAQQVPAAAPVARAPHSTGGDGAIALPLGVPRSTGGSGGSGGVPLAPVPEQYTRQRHASDTLEDQRDGVLLPGSMVAPWRAAALDDTQSPMRRDQLLTHHALRRVTRHEDSPEAGTLPGRTTAVAQWTRQRHRAARDQSVTVSPELAAAGAAQADGADAADDGRESDSSLEIVEEGEEQGIEGMSVGAAVTPAWAAAGQAGPGEDDVWGDEEEAEEDGQHRPFGVNLLNLLSPPGMPAGSGGSSRGREGSPASGGSNGAGALVGSMRALTVGPRNKAQGIGNGAAGDDENDAAGRLQGVAGGSSGSDGIGYGQDGGSSTGSDLRMHPLTLLGSEQDGNGNTDEPEVARSPTQLAVTSDESESDSETAPRHRHGLLARWQPNVAAAATTAAAAAGPAKAATAVAPVAQPLWSAPAARAPAQPPAGAGAVAAVTGGTVQGLQARAGARPLAAAAVGRQPSTASLPQGSQACPIELLSSDEGEEVDQNQNRAGRLDRIRAPPPLQHRAQAAAAAAPVAAAPSGSAGARAAAAAAVGAAAQGRRYGDVNAPFRLPLTRSQAAALAGSSGQQQQADTTASAAPAASRAATGRRR